MTALSWSEMQAVAECINNLNNMSTGYGPEGKNAYVVEATISVSGSGEEVKIVREETELRLVVED